MNIEIKGKGFLRVIKVEVKAVEKYSRRRQPGNEIEGGQTQ